MKNNVEIMGVQFVKPQDKKWYLCPSVGDVAEWENATNNYTVQESGWYAQVDDPDFLRFYSKESSQVSYLRYCTGSAGAAHAWFMQGGLHPTALTPFQWWKAEHQQTLQDKYILQVNLFHIWLGYNKAKDFVAQSVAEGLNKLKSFVNTFKGKGTEQ